MLGERLGEGVGVGAGLQQLGSDVLKDIVVEPLGQLDKTVGLQGRRVQLLVGLLKVAVAVGRGHVHQRLGEGW